MMTNLTNKIKIVYNRLESAGFFACRPAPPFPVGVSILDMLTLCLIRGNMKQLDPYRRLLTGAILLFTVLLAMLLVIRPSWPRLSFAQIYGLILFGGLLAMLAFTKGTRK